MFPQIISSAPVDGTIILSDVGCVTYVDPKYWGSPMSIGWHH